jgi:hypothetical protein
MSTDTRFDASKASSVDAGEIEHECDLAGVPFIWSFRAVIQTSSYLYRKI